MVWFEEKKPKLPNDSAAISVQDRICKFLGLPDLDPLVRGTDRIRIF